MRVTNTTTERKVSFNNIILTFRKTYSVHFAVLLTFSNSVIDLVLILLSVFATLIVLYTTLATLVRDNQTQQKKKSSLINLLLTNSPISS